MTEAADAQKYPATILAPHQGQFWMHEFWNLRAVDRG
jgi:hypothetical protein